MPRPRATYRLQMHAGFGFDDAAAIADYLKALGVSHVYCSPYLQAAPGSTHGYDVVDHSRVNDELGGPEAHARFVAKLGEVGLGQVLDIVPNHMAISGRKNAWWWDVMENGPASLYASYFDIDWHSPEEKLRNKVLAPVLGDHYGRVLSKGEIQLAREGGSFVFRYFDNAFPVAPKSMCGLLTAAAEQACSDYLAFLGESLSRLPSSTVGGSQARHRDKEVIRQLIERICAEDMTIAAAIDAEIGLLNRTTDALDALLERQNYRLSFWRTAERELGYRRFFDINTLVGLRVESPKVFDDTHRLVLDWLRTGVLDGVRVDHPDGLRDPEQYFARLRDAAPQAWVVAEKILEPGEMLRSTWAVAGTTGYDFLNVLGGLYVDRAGEGALTKLYRDFTGEQADYSEVALEKKQWVLREILGSDVNRLTAAFSAICERHRDHRDFTRHEIHHAVREAVASFPIYRTYMDAEAGLATSEDVEYVKQAIALAKSKRADLDPELFDFLQSVLLLQVPGAAESEFVMQFQQFTGPAMAKGVEDTAFYNYNRLVCLNEVGGDPGRFGVSLEEFHDYCGRMSREWPDAMLATSTHDTKRSEDVRARMALLSEIPERWRERVTDWSARAAGPDRNTEYLVYQTLVGAWPISGERLWAYVEKAVREAKRFTSWTNPHEEYEQKLRTFVEGLLADAGFVAELEAFLADLIPAGRVTALSQALVKLTAPGVPDLYQGTEIWEMSLVDPDNRRPVDYGFRGGLLREMAGMTPEEILAREEEGLPKLWVTVQALGARCETKPFAPVRASGAKAEHVIAFTRGGVMTVAPRLVMGLTAGWGDTSVLLPDGVWRNRLTGEAGLSGRVMLAALLRRFPVALLETGGVVAVD